LRATTLIATLAGASRKPSPNVSTAARYTTIAAARPVQRHRLRPSNAFADAMSVRANPRTFVVLPGHVYPDVEDVISEAESYVIVEKLAAAADVAEQAAAQDQ
jgi:hypothetical protein